MKKLLLFGIVCILLLQIVSAIQITSSNSLLFPSDTPASCDVSGNTLFTVNLVSSNIYAINITSVPTKISNFSNSTSIGLSAYDDSLKVYNDYLYFIQDASIVIFNISNVSNIKQVNNITNASSLAGAYTQAKQNDLLFIASSNNDNIVIFNVSDLVNPVQINNITNLTNSTFYKNIKISGNYLYLTGYGNASFNIVDISNISNLILTGRIINNNFLTRPENIIIDGNYAYVADYNNNSLVIINITTKSSPTIKSYVKLTNYGGSNGNSYIYKEGNYIYSTGDGVVLSVVNITNKDSPNELMKYDLRSISSAFGPTDIYVNNNYVYLTFANGIATDGLYIFYADYTTPPTADDVATNCQATKIKLFAGFGLLIIGGLVLVAFMIIRFGDINTETIIAGIISLIGLSIVVFVAYYIIAAMALSTCGI